MSSEKEVFVIKVDNRYLRGLISPFAPYYCDNVFEALFIDSEHLAKELAKAICDPYIIKKYEIVSLKYTEEVKGHE